MLHGLDPSSCEVAEKPWFISPNVLALSESWIGSIFPFIVDFPIKKWWFSIVMYIYCSLPESRLNSPKKNEHWWPIPAPNSIGSCWRPTFPGCIPDFTFEDLELYRVVCVGTTSMLNVIESSFQIGWTISGRSPGSNRWRYVNVPFFRPYEFWGYSLKFRPEE